MSRAVCAGRKEVVAVRYEHLLPKPLSSMRLFARAYVGRESLHLFFHNPPYKDP